ncbi:MAG: AtpZ/AtpI family protein [Bacteroidetes bacterium]|nr:AtpZ/AtpI family protein [Bacteroidota bacterium]
MKPEPGKNLNDYARYSGMAFQMLAIILLGVFAGWKADQWLNSKPVFTVILSLISVILAIYFVTRDLLRK